MEPATPEDEFEAYFRKAVNKNLTRVEVVHNDEGKVRRGSLPTTVMRIQVEEVDVDDPPAAEYHQQQHHQQHHLQEQHHQQHHLQEQHHHRASSCKTSPNRKPAQRSPSDRSPVRSTGEVRPVPPSGNGFLSPLGAGGESTALNSSSAPHSRSGSFRKGTRMSISNKDLQDTDTAGGAGGAAGAPRGERRRSSVYLEETVAAKLQELKDLEEDNCQVVRQFTISPKGVITDRIDSVKKKRSPSPRLSPMVGERAPRQLQVPGLGLHPGIPGRPPSLSRLLSCEKPHHVLLLGDRRVGKTALMTQFMTSEYLAALDTSFDPDTAANEKTISVSVDGKETTLQFIDLEPEIQQDHRQLYPEVDCYLLIYSIADRNSFTYISSLLRELDEMPRSFAVIVVANKSDVVRKRQVPDSEAFDLCDQFSSKFVEVSAALNHKVDELLVGTVAQTRLNARRRQRLSSSGGGKADDEPPTPAVSAPCYSFWSPRGLFARLFSKKKYEPKPCENFQTL